MICYDFMFSEAFADFTYCSSVSAVGFEVNDSKANVPKPIKMKKVKNITCFNLVLSNLLVLIYL